MTKINFCIFTMDVSKGAECKCEILLENRDPFLCSSKLSNTFNNSTVPKDSVYFFKD